MCSEEFVEVIDKDIDLPRELELFNSIQHPPRPKVSNAATKSSKPALNLSINPITGSVTASGAGSLTSLMPSDAKKKKKPQSSSQSVAAPATGRAKDFDSADSLLDSGFSQASNSRDVNEEDVNIVSLHQIDGLTHVGFLPSHFTLSSTGFIHNASVFAILNDFSM